MTTKAMEEKIHQMEAELKRLQAELRNMNKEQAKAPKTSERSDVACLNEVYNG